MGQRVLQPIVNQQVQHVLSALDQQVQERGERRAGPTTRHRRRSRPDPTGTSGADEGISPCRPYRTTVDRDRRMAVPFRIGVMQLTMEPLDEMLASARAMDDAGMDTIWLAEAYPWWRKHGMEARSSTVVSALIARETKRLTIGWGIISPFTRHPVQVAMDARVVQEAAGPGPVHPRLRDVEDLPQQREACRRRRRSARCATPSRSCAACSAASRSSTTARRGAPTCPALQAEAHTPRDVPPVYVAATAPKMQALAGEIADGCLTPSITTPAFVRYTRENGEGPTSTSAARSSSSIHATDRDKGRDGAREIAGMYLANKVQNIQGSADTLLDLAGIEQDEIRPVAEAMEQGGRLAAKAKVTDALLDKCKPIAGTPEDCIAAIEEYRDAGCTHVMLELWGEDRHEQIRLFGEQVLPHFRDERSRSTATGSSRRRAR